jgi:hypothetical protein
MTQEEYDETRLEALKFLRGESEPVPQTPAEATEIGKAEKADTLRVNYILAKPTNEWSPEERTFLSKQISIGIIEGGF